ncbi:hypothetical protein M0805_003581 [Coniferiporia weirii]|nr:hypothetical protein M0805_003581 [Coniferiporia weirii]
MASNPPFSTPLPNFAANFAAVSKYFLPITVLTICASVGHRLLRRHSRLNLFPSPPSDPFLGHVRILSTATPFTIFSEWRKTFGDIIYLTIVGHPMIVLNTAEAARDLMDKRSANYSDRPATVLHGKMIGWGNMLSFTGYNDRFRVQRRFAHQYLNSQASMRLRPIQTEQVKVFIKNLLICPKDFHSHVNRMSSASVVKLTYGHDISSGDDKFINLAVTATTRGTSVGNPGLTFVDLFPFIQFIPSWFPGASFKREAKITHDLSVKMLDEPYNKVKEERALGTAQPSLLNSLLEDYEKLGLNDSDHEINMKFATGTMYAAGVETSEVVLLTFFLMMVYNPEAMKRAQAEIDKVIGCEQLPTFADRPDLPYIDCVLKEVLRINPPLPLSLLHQSMEEDVYRGKTIPAGSIIAPNVWEMMRDERYYPNPDKFLPERFLKKTSEPVNDHVHALNTFNADDPSSLVFGFGRRICPGRFFADAGAWLAMANVLAMFDILPPIDPSTGKERLPPIEYIVGFTSKPKSFECRIIPRTAKHATLIDQDMT